MTLLRSAGVAVLVVMPFVAARDAIACDSQTDRWVGGAASYWHGTLGRADFCNNAAVGLGAVRQKAADCAWNFTIARFGAPPDPSCGRIAMESSPEGTADLNEFVRIWTIASGADCSQPSINLFFPHWHGALGRADYCNNASIGPDRQKAKECAFQALVRDKGVLPTSCLRDAIANSAQGKADLDEFIRRWEQATGAVCTPAVIDSFFPHWHGALGRADYCNNASIGPDRQKAKECAFQALVRDKGVLPTSCLRDAIADSTQGKADLDEFVRKWELATGTVCTQAAIDLFFPHWHGALGRADYCNNASIGPDRQKAKECAFQALVRDKSVVPTSCLRDAIADSPQGKADLDEFVRKWTVASGDCTQASIDAFFPHWHGALGKAEYCNNASIGPDRMKAKECAFQALRDKGVAPNSCLLEAIADSPQGKAALDEFVRIWTIASGADCTQGSLDSFFPYWHGALGKAEYCNNASIGPDREKAKNCAFEALVRDKGVAPSSCLREAIANTPQGRADLDEFVRKWRLATGADCSQETIDRFSPNWHGALGRVEYCNNPSIGPDRQAAQDCAFEALVRDLGVAPDSCLREAIANSPAGRADLDAFVGWWTALQSALPAGTVAASMKSLTPTDAEEACLPSKALDNNYLPPKSMLDWTPTVPGTFAMKGFGFTLPGNLAFDATQHFSNSLGANEGRLRAELRAAAKRAEPVFTLCESATAFARGDTALGEALADLSVTGKRSFSRFRSSPPNEDRLRRCSTEARAVASALDRAYAVANAIRFAGSPRRRALGWIAVSGEDDQPHRPVNVPSAEFPQHDLPVTVPVRGYNGMAGPGPITLNTRYMIAYPPPAGLASPPRASGRELPADPAPVLPPDAEVILYVHGMDSRLEEALDLTHALHRISSPGGKMYTVISMDLPTSGYADNIDHLRIASLETVGQARFRPVGPDIELMNVQLFDGSLRHDVPTVDFIEDFIVAFVDTLDGRLPGLKQKVRAVVGGSLGGNMAMRLGRRPDLTWIKNVVPWSPAAIWPSFADGGAFDRVAVAVPWLWAGGDARVVPESDVMRRLFFYYGFDWRMGVVRRRPQPEEWYRDGWDCKASHVFAARLDRHETYDPTFRLWHWRLATEQLVFSQQLTGIDTRQPLYMQNTTPMLLICGYEDTGGDLCGHTRQVAWKMTNTPGRAFFLRDTGHSVHAERPNWLARNMLEFLERR